MIIPNFEELLPLYDGYYRLMDQSEPSFNNDLAMEGRKRIQQVNKILNILKKFHVKVDKFHGAAFQGDRMKATRRAVREYIKADDEMEMYADFFYWVAFRLLAVLEKLPHFKGIKRESKGVVLTRNWLIEHTEIHLQGFAVGAWGPVVKAVRYEDQKDIFPANPLYEDAQILKDAIEKSLKKVLV